MAEGKILLYRQIAERTLEAASAVMTKKHNRDESLSAVWVLIQLLQHARTQDAERLEYLKKSSGWDFLSFENYLTEAVKETSYEELDKLLERLNALYSHMGHIESRLSRQVEQAQSEYRKTVKAIYEKF